MPSPLLPSGQPEGLPTSQSAAALPCSAASLPSPSPLGLGQKVTTQEDPRPRRPVSTRLPQGLCTCNPLPEPLPPLSLSPLRPLLGWDLVSEPILSASCHTAATPRPLQHLLRVTFLYSVFHPLTSYEPTPQSQAAQGRRLNLLCACLAPSTCGGAWSTVGAQ